jgi:hypothetical protein
MAVLTTSIENGCNPATNNTDIEICLAVHQWKLVRVEVAVEICWKRATTSRYDTKAAEQRSLGPPGFSIQHLAFTGSRITVGERYLTSGAMAKGPWPGSGATAAFLA